MARLAGIVLLAALASVAAPAVAVQIIPGLVEPMRAGDAAIADAIAPQGRVVILVNLRIQRIFVYRNGLPIGVATISSGRPGYRTPTGAFTILQKAVRHRSRRYANAPMPFMQRLTWGGVALHGGDIPGYPASHGCIRLPMPFARWLYSITRLGETVIVTDGAGVPSVLPSAAPRGPDDPVGGPVALVISVPDRRIVLIRDGTIENAYAVQAEIPVTATAACTLRAIAAGGWRWSSLPIGGQSAGAGADCPQADLLVGSGATAAALRVGTTLLVTTERLSDGAW